MGSDCGSDDERVHLPAEEKPDPTAECQQHKADEDV